MRNKLKAVVAGTVLLAASGAAFAGGNVSFGITIGGPAFYPAPVYAAPPVVYYPPAPVYYAPPVVYHRPYYAPGVVVRYRGGGGHHNHHRAHHRHHHR
jgi:hypothetical protein